ncbi:MAG: iron-containing alcohol dehydrogenase [Thiothrix sp.]|nr:iron-containing alcohol dehydrogenase [Thiothrix sp.]HPQ95753.1 iron-containing alcohol dehydrogenase [Thiolinea sp.]
MATRPVHTTSEPDWMALIDDIYRGRWVIPNKGTLLPASPIRRLHLGTDLDGMEAELIASAGLSGKAAIVADARTMDALGTRISTHLGRTDTILLEHPHADLATVAELSERTRAYDYLIAVGSGTLNDLCKYVTAQDGRDYCVFGTAASMDGYTSSTASITLESGLKISLPAHAPKGVFMDIGVIAAAPAFLAASGFGDCVCSSVCQVDWWMSHRLLDSFYDGGPYLLMAEDEKAVFARAAGIRTGELEAIGSLVRLLMLSGLGVAITGVSNHGSMGEHQISHYIDCFARERHPGTLHGEQVGVATLTVGRIQQGLLGRSEPPVMQPTRLDEADMRRRMGPAIAEQCLAEYRKKALDQAGAERLNARLAEIWPQLQQECAGMIRTVEDMKALLEQAGSPTSAADLGLAVDFYREAVNHAHEMRNRYSFTDIACNAGVLADFAAREA